MRVRRRTNLLLGAVLLLVALVVVANALGLLPPALYDIILRAWPALLIVAGLAGLLRGRVPASGLIAAVVTLVVVGVVASGAYSRRATEQRTEFQQPIAQLLGEGIGLLNVRVTTLGTDVEILRGVDPDAGITGLYEGSTESRVWTRYDEPAEGIASFELTEAWPNAVPMLAAVGRGRLRLEVPPGVPLDLMLVGGQGDVTLNLRETALERLNLDLGEGDALVILPEYQPVSAAENESQGTLAVRGGTITIVVPDRVAARLELDRGGSGIEPEYDPSIYNFLFNRLLEARAIESADTVVQYTVVAPRGRVRLDVEPGDAAPAATAEGGS